LNKHLQSGAKKLPLIKKTAGENPVKAFVVAKHAVKHWLPTVSMKECGCPLRNWKITVPTASGLDSMNLDEFHVTQMIVSSTESDLVLLLLHPDSSLAFSSKLGSRLKDTNLEMDWLRGTTVIIDSEQNVTNRLEIPDPKVKSGLRFANVGITTSSIGKVAFGFTHRVNTTPGDSGSPLILEDNGRRFLTAIHVGCTAEGDDQRNVAASILNVLHPLYYFCSKDSATSFVPPEPKFQAEVNQSESFIRVNGTLLRHLTKDYGLNEYEAEQWANDMNRVDDEMQHAFWAAKYCGYNEEGADTGYTMEDVMDEYDTRRWEINCKYGVLEEGQKARPDQPDFDSLRRVFQKFEIHNREALVKTFHSTSHDGLDSVTEPPKVIGKQLTRGNFSFVEDAEAKQLLAVTATGVHKDKHTSMKKSCEPLVPTQEEGMMERFEYPPNSVSMTYESFGVHSSILRAAFLKSPSGYDYQLCDRTISRAWNQAANVVYRNWTKRWSLTPIPPQILKLVNDLSSSELWDAVADYAIAEAKNKNVTASAGTQVYTETTMNFIHTLAKLKADRILGPLMVDHLNGKLDLAQEYTEKYVDLDETMDDNLFWSRKELYQATIPESGRVPLASPVKLFIKDEPHKESKLTDKRARLICVVDVLDRLALSLVYMRLLPTFADWADNVGSASSYSFFPSERHSLQVKPDEYYPVSTDCKAFDWSTAGLDCAHRNALCVALMCKSWIGVLDDHIITVFKKYLIGLNVAHYNLRVFSIAGVAVVSDPYFPILYEELDYDDDQLTSAVGYIPLVCAAGQLSGRLDTTFSNNIARQLVHYTTIELLRGDTPHLKDYDSFPSIVTAGDDAVERLPPHITIETFLSCQNKATSQTIEQSDAYEFCSRRYVYTKESPVGGAWVLNLSNKHRVAFNAVKTVNKTQAFESLCYEFAFCEEGSPEERFLASTANILNHDGTLYDPTHDPLTFLRAHLKRVRADKSKDIEFEEITFESLEVDSLLGVLLL